MSYTIGMARWHDSRTRVEERPLADPGGNLTMPTWASYTEKFIPLIINSLFTSLVPLTGSPLAYDKSR